MIQLNEHQYYLLTEPLKSVSINTYFGSAVINGKINGKIFADDTDNPHALLCASSVWNVLAIWQS